MDKNSLSLSFCDSLTEDVAGIVGEYAELGLEALVEDGLLRDIPIVSTAVSVYKIGKSIHERHHVTKLVSFLNEINKGIIDQEHRLKYQEKFSNNEKFRNQELEYVLILIDRYISFDKPKMLAKLYLAYLDGEIVWEEFTMYAEIINLLLPGDYPLLVQSDTHLTNIGRESGAILRLVGLGLLNESTNQTAVVSTWDKRHAVSTPENRERMNQKLYVKTDCAKCLIRIVQREK